MHLRSYKMTSLTKFLSLCGLVRIESRWPHELVSCVDVTLKELQKVVKKYEVIGDASKRKRIWEKLKWSLEFKSIDSLRSKVSWPVHVNLL
jgi:Mor family transcriptional regulator